MISNARLKLILERADKATAAGISGPFQMDHGQLVGFVSEAGRLSPGKELFATGHYVAGNAALRCASSADPETMRELVRGYRMAKDAGWIK